MSTEATAAYVEEFLPEDEPLLMARRNAAQVGGASPVSPAVGATLRFIAAALSAKAVVEIGTGCGTSGIWLLRGMRHDAVLTSVDVEPEHQRLARRAYTEARFASNRFRLILGKASDVLPRLTDGGYDLMWVGGEPGDYAEHLREAPRLLRVGGVVAFADGQRAVSREPDPRSAAVRDVARTLLDSDQFAVVLLPVGTGILAGTKRPVR